MQAIKLNPVFIEALEKNDTNKRYRCNTASLES